MSRRKAAASNRQLASVPNSLRYLERNSIANASTAETDEPITTAQPAPAMPSLGKPAWPKISRYAVRLFAHNPVTSTSITVQLSPRPAKKLFAEATISAGNAA